MTINNWGSIDSLVKDEKKRLHQFKIWCKSPFQIFAKKPFSWHLDCDELKNCYHSKEPISHRISLFDIIGSLGKQSILSSFSSNRPTRRLSVNPFHIFSFLQLSALKMKRQMDWLRVLWELRLSFPTEICLVDEHWSI